MSMVQGRYIYIGHSKYHTLHKTQTGPFLGRAFLVRLKQNTSVYCGTEFGCAVCNAIL